MIEEYLRKLQRLQATTLGTPVYMQIETRWDNKDKEPWLVITLIHQKWVEGDGKDDTLYLSVHMYQRAYYTQEENEASQAIVYERIKSYVNNLINKG